MDIRQNQHDPLDAVRLSLQAREILSVLAQYQIANDELLTRWLQKIGLAISRGRLAELLDRLEREAMIESEHVEQVRVIRLRMLGGEVAAGVETIDWIARPEPSV